MIRVIPNTGIQYVALPQIPLDRLRKHDFALRRGQQFHQVQPDGPSAQSLDPLDGYETEATGFRKRSADMVLIDQLLGAFPEGLWLPLPFEGGSLWVSTFLRKTISDRGVQQVDVVLAVDTTLECDGNPDGVAPEELGDRAPFPCSLRFWRHRTVQARLALLSQALPSQRGRPEEQLEQLQVALAGLADLFARLGHARIALERRPQNSETVVVNMMLDLGNSRTCVLLAEQDQGGRRQGLELRYPDDPSRMEMGPFSTQSAFVEHEIIPVGVGETVSFRFLSIIKLSNPSILASPPWSGRSSNSWSKRSGRSTLPHGAEHQSRLQVMIADARWETWSSPTRPVSIRMNCETSSAPSLTRASCGRTSGPRLRNSAPAWAPLPPTSAMVCLDRACR